MRSDIYSIGVLLFHLVTRSYPVQGAGLDDLRAAHDRGERIDIRTARPGISRKLAGIIQRAIEPVPDRRYGSVEAMAGDLVSLSSRPRLATVTPVLGCGRGGVPRSSRSCWSGEADRLEVPGRSISFAPGFARLLPGNPSPIQHPVIVVLPFDNLGTQPDSDMLVEGLTVEILNDLAQIEGLAGARARVVLRAREKPRPICGTSAGSSTPTSSCRVRCVAQARSCGSTPSSCSRMAQCCGLTSSIASSGTSSSSRKRSRSLS